MLVDTVPTFGADFTALLALVLSKHIGNQKPLWRSYNNPWPVNRERALLDHSKHEIPIIVHIASQHQITYSENVLSHWREVAARRGRKLITIEVTHCSVGAFPGHQCDISNVSTNHMKLRTRARQLPLNARLLGDITKIMKFLCKFAVSLRTFV